MLKLLRVNLNVLFEVGPKDIPRKCYIGTLVPGLFEIIQWIDNDEALGELRAVYNFQGVKPMVWRDSPQP